MKFAARTVAITPDDPTQMGGYLPRIALSIGTHRDLFCRILVIEEGPTTAIILSLDLVGLHRSFVDELRVDLAARYGLPTESLLVHCTHTHSGPSTFPFPAFLSPVDDGYLARLQATISDAVDKTLNATEDGTAYAYRGTTYIGMNRRRVDHDRISLAPSPKGPVDRTLNVLEIRDRSGITRVIAFGCGCHPTVLGPRNLLFSPDYPGAACEALECRFPHAMAMFVSGAGGDVNPAVIATDDGKFGSGSLRNVEFIGTVLSNDVAQAMACEASPVRGSLGVRTESVNLPVAPAANADILEWAKGQPDSVQRYAQSLVSRRDAPEQAEVYVALVSLGRDWALLGIEAELCAELAAPLRAAVRATHVFVAAFTNGILGYLPTRRVLSEGGYEADAGFISYGVAWRFADSAPDTLCNAVRRLSTGADEG